MGGEAVVDEELLNLVCRKIQELKQPGSTRVPLARLGRDPEVHAALQGRSLLQQLEFDTDAYAIRGLAPRFAMDYRASTLTVGLRDSCLTNDTMNDHVDGDEAQAKATSETSPQRTLRRGDAGARFAVDVLAEGPGFVAVRKLHGITTETMLIALQAQLDAKSTNQHHIVSVSRLDRDTSGVLVAATSAEGAECLTEQFKEHSVYKRYLALCKGRVKPLTGEVRARLYISGFAEKYRAYVSPKGKDACTRYEVLQQLVRTAGDRPLIHGKFRSKRPDLPMLSGAEREELEGPLRHYCLLAPGAPLEAPVHNEPVDDDAKEEDLQWYSLLACYPLTGRTHQIRAHLAWLGHPLVADANYNSRGQVREQFGWCPRLWLHCQRMQFRDLAGNCHDVEAQLPPDLAAVLEDRLTACSETSSSKQ